MKAAAVTEIRLLHISLRGHLTRKNVMPNVKRSLFIVLSIQILAQSNTVAQDRLFLRSPIRVPESEECALYQPADIAFIGQNAIVIHSEGKALSSFNLNEGTCTPTRYLTLADVHRQIYERDLRRRISRLSEVLDLDGVVRTSKDFRGYYEMPASIQRVLFTRDSTYRVLLAQMTLVCGENDRFYTLLRHTHAAEMDLGSDEIRLVTPDNAGEYWPAWHSLYIDTAGTYWFSTFLLDNHAKVFDAQPFLCAFDSDGVPLSRCVYLPVEAAKRKGYVYLQNSLVELYPGLVATVSIRYPQLVVFDTESLQSVAFELDSLLPPRGLNVASRSYEFVASNKAGTIEYALAYFDSTGTRVGQWLMRHTIDRSGTVASILRTEVEPVPLSITLGPGAAAPDEETTTAGTRPSTIRRLVMHDDEWYVVTTGLHSTTD